MPRNRVIGPDDELARADFSREVAQHFRREDERVVVHRPHIFRRLLLELDLGVAVPRGDTTGVVRARRIRRQETAAVRRAHLEIREPVECAFEDQLREADRGVERIADRVREPAVSFETLGELRRTLRVDEDEHAEVFAFLPERVELRVRKIDTRTACADGRAAQAELLHAMLELFGCELRRLERHGGERDQTVGIPAAHFGKGVVLDAADLGREVLFVPIPERIDAQRFDIDALAIHARC